MNYLSIEFAVALVAFFPLYWALASRVVLQKGLLLAASYAFYATWDWRFAAMLAGFSLAVHACAHLIDRAANPRARQAWLAAAIGLCLAYLAAFKYFDFFREGLQQLVTALGGPASLPTLEILVPVGISFYVFNAIGYLVAIHRSERERPAGAMDLALFMGFFPSLLAGPVLRPEGMLRQIEGRDPRRLVEPGLANWLIVLGVGKKLVAATWLAGTWVDPLFAEPGRYNGVELALGLAAYAVQIFCDFSGYTDVVTGIALLLGYRLPVNFAQPYLAQSVKDFWRRWHVSLSTFIRDFVYLPLGGNRVGFVRAQVNILAAMLLSGLWHGADLKYIVWGALHGAAVVACNLWRTAGGPALPRMLGVTLTFGFVCLAWTFFRADSLSSALAYLAAMANLARPFAMDVPGGLALLGVFFLLSAHSRTAEQWCVRFFESGQWGLRAGLTLLLALVMIECGPSGVPAFIYFQF